MDLNADAEPASLAAEFDAAHKRAHEAYARRDASAYIDLFHPELEYTQGDGRTIGRDELAHDLRVQLARMRSVEMEFRRETLEWDGGAGIATETLQQRATFQVRAFGIVRREWTVRRRGRYGWLRTVNGWKLRRVQVLTEEVLPTRTWLAIR